MKNLVLTVAVLAPFLVAAVPPAAAQTYPWCAEYNGRGGGGRNCGFVTREQCMATISGIGGMCVRNLLYPDRDERPRKRSRARS